MPDRRPGARLRGHEEGNGGGELRLVYRIECSSRNAACPGSVR